MTEEQMLAGATLGCVNWMEVRFNEGVPGLSHTHIRGILEDVVLGKVTGNKAQRYIGWAQAVLTMQHLLTLNEAREINRNILEALND